MTIRVFSNPANIGFSNLYRVLVTADAAGSAIVDLSGLYRASGTNSVSPVIQATGSNLTTEFTLDDPDLAASSPERVTWTAGPPVAAGALVICSNHVGTAIRLTFAGAGRAVLAIN
jgi:hypothetical protein